MDIVVKDYGEITLSGQKTLHELSDNISAEGALVALVDGELTDLNSEVVEGSEIEFLDFSDRRAKEVFWHSTAHILASAVKNIRPDVKLGIGPAVEVGFYYDFLADPPLTDEDLVRIEGEMERIIREAIPFRRIEMDFTSARRYLQKSNENLKLELLREKVEGDKATFYKIGDFMDLCLGPHIPDSSYVGGVKLLSVAGAYWKGDENNPMLSRVQGVSFLTREELDEHLELLEEAKKRDHRILGKRFSLFTIEESSGSGLAIWLPDGEFIYNKIEEFWKEVHKKHDYIMVRTPHIYKADLFKKSGHYDYYIDNMFTLNIEDQEYVLKPMNCPGHMFVYQSRLRSYRDLPLKITELGTVYRDERSGTLHGLMRVRGFTIDDAHIYCSEDQIVDEIVDVLDMSEEILSAFGFEEYQLELSVRDPEEKDKYIGTDEKWDMAENYLIEAMKRKSLDYVRMEGEAVFYGPKIDLKLKDSLGRMWQTTTIQFDFNLPGRFELEYMDRDGQKKSVYIIHRAILGSFERFIGVLIEEYAGAFPLWLAPVQVLVLPIAERHNNYASKVIETIEDEGIRVEIDASAEKLGARIRKGEMNRIPYILILGDREEQNENVSVRKRDEGDIGTMEIDELTYIIKREIENKTINR